MMETIPEVFVDISSLLFVRQS